MYDKSSEKKKYRCRHFITIYWVIFLQVKQRADECIKALDLLININSGKHVENVLLSEFDWSKLKVSTKKSQLPTDIRASFDMFK